MNNRYQQASFAFSANREDQLAADARIEIAFAGRSNAGKSSALNTLTNQKALARVSRTPLTRAVLRGIVLLMDIRHPMKDLDIRMLECCAERQLPAHILLTKADKLSRGAAGKQLQAVRGELANWHAPFSVQMFSSLKKEGLPALVAQLDQWMAGDDDAC